MSVTAPSEPMLLAPKDAAKPAIGAATSRVDARLKVTGGARYGSDIDGGRQPAHGYLRTSAIARGRITRIDETAARRVPGVLEILTFRNVGDRIKPGKTFSGQGYMGSSIAPLASDRIQHAGQIVALVVADSFEAARDAAQRLDVSYAEERPSATFDSPGLKEGLTNPKPKSKEGEDSEDENPKVGDAAGAFAAAPVRIDQHYETPTQHHNPIELFTTTCAWNGDELTVWESSQNMYGFKNGLAEQLGIPADKVRTVSPFVGGAFGSRGSLTQRTAIVALAAKRVGRPVRLEATRSQGFTIATYRAETRHRVRLAAGHDGKLQALIHEGWEISSRPDDYKVAGTDASTRLYACPNVDSNVTIVHTDRNTPGFMRSPPETPYLFALESAMDELAVALKMDPVELRRVNDTQVEPIKGLPYTSRALMPCFDAAAAAFGWAKRTPEPGSMRDGDWLIGWGCASSMYPTQMGAASARVTLSPQGRIVVQTATHEIGQGVMTVIALTAADQLGVPLDQVTVEVGDSRLPPSPVAGGSNSTASVCNVVAKACADIRERIVRAAVAPSAPFAGVAPASLVLADGKLTAPDGRTEPLAQAMARAAGGAIEAYAENIPHGVKPDALQGLYKGQGKLAGGAKMKDRIQFAFGAQFAEVRVHRLTREVRASRVVGAYAAGRIMNPKTAKSQLMGGQVWGISAALHEATEIDRRSARYYNDDLAEYLIPVNADITRVETIFLPEQDEKVNDLGIKGLGELGNVGLNAAVANAVWHATGVRVRELPVRIEKLLVA
ncbi:xanthine dehydrogenase family protein molybdopterin-binding subunit [uncultured Sphingomonas sp.]|uniref:xanthine dehydrogenase family protein molybdopterin-binding subunit n=1 Tax=uncultured Sphingomonas sp. TaxID=158754 RepID=UPI0035CBA22C